MKTFILASGIPGSGKSTAIFKEFPSATIISPDDFIGYTEQDPWTFYAARQAWKKADALLVEAFERGDELIVFDATFPKSKKRRKYVNRALSYGYEPVCLYCPCPLKISLARNAERSKFRKVPEKIIEDMDKKLEVPNEEEGFKKILTFNSITNKLINK